MKMRNSVKMKDMNTHVLCKIGIILLFGIFLIYNAYAKEDRPEEIEMEQFQRAFSSDWTSVMYDSCTGNWNDKWFLDGQRAQVKNSDKGMFFSGGPTSGDSSCHAVLWTKEIFSGDIKIEYEYTRMDCADDGGVNILYFLASGIGEGQYVSDISEWSDRREIPVMSAYLRYMKLLHISYAAFGSDAPEGKDYVRARHYPVKEGGNKNRFSPTFFDTGLFKPGATYRITVIKKDNDLYFNVEFLADGAVYFFNPKTDRKSKLFHWNIENAPKVLEGRIGLRHMATRASRYKNFRVSVLKSK